MTSPSAALLQMAAAGNLRSPSRAISSCSLGDALQRCRDAVAIHVAATPDCELVEMEDVLDGRRFDAFVQLQRVPPPFSSFPPSQPRITPTPHRTTHAPHQPACLLS